MKRTAFFYIITAGILWGTSGIFVHYLAPFGFTSFQMTAVRAIVSFLCMALFAFIKDRSLFRIRPLQLLLFAGIGASLFFTSSCYYSSMQMTSVSTAVVLMYTAPVYVMVFSVLLLNERLTKLKLIAVACMLIGCCLVAGIVGGLKFDAVGMLLGVLAGVSYAAYNVLTKIAMQKGVPTVTVTLYGFLFMALLSLFVLQPNHLFACAGENPVITLPLLLGLGVCTFVVPYFLYTLAMRDLSAGTASALGVVEPMSATMFSVVLFQESLDVFSVLGIFLILGAIYLMGKAEASPSHPKDAKPSPKRDMCPR